tara:strand:- start:922 stop:1224 length:303 start_codon:yes stop_codon:yes gene_type:complete
MNKNENSLNCVIREVKEEINLNLQKKKISYVTNVSFEIKKKLINRYIYEVSINKADYNMLKISEGQKVEKIYKESLLSKNIVPYDYLALWIYLDSERFRV